MLPFLRLGPFLLQLPGLALLGGLWLGAELSEREAERIASTTARAARLPAAIYNLIFAGMVAGVVAARLAYAARFAGVYLANPLSLLALTSATLSPEWGLAVGLLAAVLYGTRQRLPLRPTLDALAPGLAVFLVALGLSHLLSGDAFGAPAYGGGGHSPLPWAIYLWDDYRQPTQVYEIIAALLILGVSLRRPFGPGGRGLNFMLVVALAAAARVFIEAFRGDSLIWSGGFRAAQVVGLAVWGGALWLMHWWSVAARPEVGEPAKLDKNTHTV